MNDIALANQIKKKLDTSKRGLSMQYENTATCYSYYNALNPMTYEDRIQFMDEYGRRRRALVNFGAIQPNVDSVIGFMAQNRRQAKYLARVPNDPKSDLYTRNMNALYTYHRDVQNADQIETEQDADMMICGYGATETDLSYIVGKSATNPNGDIVKRKLDSKKVGWDPHARGKNILDARWAYYYDDHNLKEALNLFQGSVPEDFAPVSDSANSDKVGYTYNPFGGMYDRIKLEDNVEWADSGEETVRVYNFQWFEYETFYRVLNPLYIVADPLDALYMKAKLELLAKSEDTSSGIPGIETKDAFRFDPLAEELTLDEKTNAEFVKEFGSMIKPIPFKRKVFWTCVISGTHVFNKFKSISQSGFSIKFKTGIFNETDKFWVGMVNAMIEPQKYRNKTITEILFTIAANSKGGVMVEEGAVEDITDFENKWAKTDAVIKVAKGAISTGMIQEKAKAAVPTGLEGIVQLSAQAISDNGVDPAFLGEAGLQESGVLYKRRIRQVISKMARYFDSLTLYQKEDARLHDDLIHVWIENNNGEWVRITGKDGAEQFQQISEDMVAPEYDVSIQEAPSTPEDKEQIANMLVTQAMTLLQVNPAAGTAFLSEGIRLLPLESDMETRLIQALQPSESVPMQQYQMLQAKLQEMQSQIAQLAAAKTAAEIENIKAKTDKERAGAAETMESAANKGLENDIIRQHGYDKATVSI